MTTVQAAEHAASAPRSGAPRIHFAGAGGIYLDCGDARIDVGIQQRIWALAKALRGPAHLDGIREIVPGVNNILVLFDPLQLAPHAVRDWVLAQWEQATAAASAPRVVDIPVIYGGDGGIDLQEQAQRAGLGVHDYVALHSSAQFQVMCIGSTPGFSYLSGLPERLHAPRRSVPRLRIPRGSVVIGGVQAGVMPEAAPSGWHILGVTSAAVFDATRAAPCLFEPGDTVRFVAREVIA
ncbi:5-oxoprolinase subunit PxpB [Pantoea sp. 18069]|uniref:5-oxoprolinase subunit PxpB n=1 Tax=Pantoea sp. 18069 TaxID=2681415 RepID=UPI00135872CB|nr:5-oxoprolinase subunit PxpB [Pantoea sp. 18069]